MAQEKSMGRWGLTYADVGLSQDEHQSHHNCQIEWSIHRVRKHRNALHAVWVVGAFAIRRRGRPEELRGYGSCDVGGARGAGSMPGAMLRAMMEAVADLERRAADTRYDRDTPPERLPGM